MPDKPWIPYEVVPIAPNLRPVDEEHGATADMCIPIGPNTSHPNGREPLETEPQFPFRNCYHWSDGKCTMDVRVRARPEKFDDDVAISLPPHSCVKLWGYMDQDYACMARTRKSREVGSSGQPDLGSTPAEKQDVIEEKYGLVAS